MPLMNRISLIAVLVLASLAAARKPENSPPAPTSFDVPGINAYVAAQVKAKGIPALSLVVMKEGKIELAQAYGTVSLGARKPATTNTPFAIGSVTKQFTCACILLLAEEGKLSVQDKVAKYYPNLTRANDISLLDLMNHVSGYPDYYPLDFVDRRMASSIAADELIRQYATGKLDFEPGTRFSYSNTGFVILGRVVEKVSGEMFGKFLERRILQPLAMEHTLYEPRQPGESLAQGCRSFALGPQEMAAPEGLGWCAAAGALFSTPSDLAKWDLALMEGKVLKPGSWSVMTARRKLADGRMSDYGCGLSVRSRSGSTVLAHNGAVSGFLAYNAMIPATRSAVIVLVNCEDGTSASKLHATLLSLLLPKPPPSSPLASLTNRPAANLPASPPALPAISGPSAIDAAKDFLSRLQAGRIDRGQLGEEFSYYLDSKKIRGASARLKPYGKPAKVELARSGERGGMEVVVVRFTFKSGVLETLMYRSPDGKIQQFFVSKE
jgi:D-alanyl-D-alanine carboxypeptidase